MTFEVNGQQYRIGFQHQRPRDWASHATHYATHRITIAPVFRWGRRDRERRQVGVMLYCHDCGAELAGMSPRVAGKLDYGVDRKVSTTPGSRLVDHEHAREVTCIVYRRLPDGMDGDGKPIKSWESMLSGKAKLNVDAGDKHKRELGRIAALRAALPIKPKAPIMPEEPTPEQTRAYVVAAKALLKALDAYNALLATHWPEYLREDAERRAAAFCGSAMLAYEGRHLRAAIAEARRKLKNLGPAVQGIGMSPESIPRMGRAAARLIVEAIEAELIVVDCETKLARIEKRLLGKPHTAKAGGQ